jgi:hypothetical protein
MENIRLIKEQLENVKAVDISVFKSDKSASIIGVSEYEIL